MFFVEFNGFLNHLYVYIFLFYPRRISEAFRDKRICPISRFRLEYTGHLNLSCHRKAA